MPRLMAAIAGPRNAPVVPWSTRPVKTTGKFGQKSNNECGDSNHDGAERCQSPLRADCIQQLATRHEGKQAGETARGEDDADIPLSPFLLGQINGYIGTETSQHGRIEKIDSVKTVQARTRWRGFSSMGQRHNECHLLTVVLSENSIRPGIRIVWQNHRMIGDDARNPAITRNVYYR